MHLQPRFIVLVMVGGALGVAAREALILAFPWDDVPWTIAAVNVAGAFLLGFLLDLLPRFGEDAGGRRVLRLFLGTGMLGGFTTYSALATDTAHLTSDGLPLAGTGYALVSLVLGVLAAAAGMRAAGAVRLTPQVTPVPDATGPGGTAGPGGTGGPGGGTAAGTTDGEDAR